nr:right-handed parallel beta-helix repeat-containing protein [Phytoactinopolyspora alkaliphila]
MPETSSASAEAVDSTARSSDHGPEIRKDWPPRRPTSPPGRSYRRPSNSPAPTATVNPPSTNPSPTATSVSPEPTKTTPSEDPTQSPPTNNETTPPPPATDDPTTEPTTPPPSDIDGYPSDETTGVPPGVTLKPSGSLTITKDNTVIDALDIKGTVKVQANNVTIKRSRIFSTGRYAIDIESGYRNLVVEDTEIDGNNATATIAILRGEYTLRRVNIHSVYDGPRIEGHNVVIEDSYIHHLTRVPDGHHDTIQIRSGTNIVIRGNNLQAYNPSTNDPMNAAIQFGSLLAPIDDVVVENNLMNGGNMTINAGKLEGGSVIFRNNEFGRDFRYGVVSTGPGLVWESSNVYHDTGESVR